jgi:flagellar biosynthesis/type III secretory pathway M-ring protein FliF/YscJ
MTESQKVKVGPELKRMTAAILLDQSLEDKKDEISKIVGAAIGFDQSRGDEISVMVMEMAALPEPAFEVEDGGSTTSVTLFTWIERGLWALVGLAFLFFALRTVKKAQAGLRDVLEASLEDEQPVEAVKPITLEETVLDTAMQDTELAGRSLRRWLYEGVGERV